MTRKIQFLLLLAALFLLFPVAFGQQGEVPKYIREAPGGENYPGADSLILKELVHYTLLPDGRIKKHVMLARKLFTDYACSRLCDPRIPFNTAEEDLHVIQSRTYRKDFTIVDTQKNGFNLSSARALDRAPDYADIQEMVVTHVGVERGAATVLEYEITDKTPPPTSLWFKEFFGGEEPCLLKEVHVALPEQKQAFIHLEKGDGITFTQTKGEDKTVFSWTAENLPVAPLSEEKADAEEVLPMLVLHTFPDWDAKDFPPSSTWRTESSEAIRKKAEALTSGAKSSMEKLKALADFVAEDIRTVHWDLGDFHFKARKASRVLETSYGHSLDKAVLLASLIQESDLPENGFSPVIGLTGRNSIESALVGITIWEVGASLVYWCDPTTKLSYASLPENKWRWSHCFPSPCTDHLDYLEDHSSFLETPPPDLFRFSGIVKISQGGKKLSGTGNITVEGSCNPYFNHKALQVDTCLGGALNGAKITSTDPLHLTPARSAFEVTWEGDETLKNNCLAFSIPYPKSVLKDLPLSLPERTFPLFLPAGTIWEVEMEIQYDPNQLALEAAPESFSFGTGSLVYNTEISYQEWSIKVKRKLSIVESEIPAENYPDIRKALTRILSEGDNTLIFRKK